MQSPQRWATAFALQVRVETVIASPRCTRVPRKLAKGRNSKSHRRWLPAVAQQPLPRGVATWWFGCGRPAPGGFPVPFRLMRCSFRLQEEMLQREEAESTLQSFRQVCRYGPTRSHRTPPNQPTSNSKSYLNSSQKRAKLHVCTQSPLVAVRLQTAASQGRTRKSFFTLFQGLFQRNFFFSFFATH